MNPHLPKQRSAAFFQRCPRFAYSGTLYHGTPRVGLAQMLRFGIAIPEHGELGMPLFSTSLNDNMLRFFSDGDGVTGLEFEVRNLQCVELDQFHQYLAMASDSCLDMWLDYARDNEAEEMLAHKLEYAYGSGVIGIRPQDLEELLPRNTEAICLPDWDNQIGPNHEAEVAITKAGCEHLMDRLIAVYVDGERREVDGSEDHKDVGWILNEGEVFEYS